MFGLKTHAYEGAAAGNAPRVSREKLKQTVRKLRELSIEWRKERAGRNFNRFRPNWPSDAT